MTFGKIKSAIEKNLLESYKNEQEFKKSLREFNHNILENKSISKIYSLYDQLTTPQGLTESDAKEYLEEGINLIQKLIVGVKLPKTISENIDNKYSDLDTVVYTNKTNLLERVQCKKNIVSNLTKKSQVVSESINIPIKSMISIGNKNLNEYIENLDEDTKREFLQLVSEDSSSIVAKFNTLRESATNKLQLMVETESDDEMKNKLSETINTIKTEKFDYLTYLKLKTLEQSI
jgi:polyhydroxyalkanoate synthesis regulator phasin